MVEPRVVALSSLRGSNNNGYLGAFPGRRRPHPLIQTTLQKRPGAFFRRWVGPRYSEQFTILSRVAESRLPANITLFARCISNSQWTGHPVCYGRRVLLQRSRRRRYERLFAQPSRSLCKHDSITEPAKYPIRPNARLQCQERHARTQRRFRSDARAEAQFANRIQQGSAPLNGRLQPFQYRARSFWCKWRQQWPPKYFARWNLL